jgi:HNH endonuclease
MRAHLAGLRVKNAVIDGACLLSRSIFNELLLRRGCTIFYAFDLLYLNDRDVRQLPLIERKEKLRALIEKDPMPDARAFFGETCDDEGRPKKVWLFHAQSTPIKRQVKGEANPYDPTYETYFEEREGAHMLETFRGISTLRYLWHEQRGLCTLCNTKITRITGWRLHYCVPHVKGGSTGATNCVLLHPECHDRVHRQRLPVSKPRLL